MKTISWTLRGLAAAVLLAAAAGRADAGSIYYSGGLTVNNYNLGYGLENWEEFTAVLDAATSDRVTVGSGFTDLDAMLANDALFVAQGGSSATRLTDLELDNIGAFIATGRRVLFTGEGSSAFNRQILEFLGGALAGSATTETTAIVSNEITAGASTVYVPIGRAGSGGTPLYDQAFATLWGDNVLTILDMNIWSDPYWARNDNARFATNVAAWLSTTPTAAVPEPSSFALLALGGGSIAYARRRTRRVAKSA